MVNKFLKIAGVKTEADFYKKYPSEAAFFKAHPEAKDLKKMKQGGQQKKLNQLTNWTNDVDGIVPIAQVGIELDMWGNPVQQNIVQMPTNPNAGTGQMGLNNAPGGTMNLTGAAADTNAANQLQMWGTGADITQGGTLGGKTPDAIKGVASEMKGSGALGKLGGIGGIMKTAGTIASGIQEAKEEKKLLQQSKQQKAVSDLTLQASQLRPEKVKRKYVRPEDAMFQPDQLSPSYGVGTNYLAENGTMMRAQNGFMDSLNNPQNILGRGASESTSIPKHIRQISTPMPIRYDLEKLRAMEQLITSGRPIRRDDVGIDARIHSPMTGWREGVEGGGIALVNRNGGITNMQIGGNLTEIQNMYNPGDLYQDLGYEPLNDADRVKQYYYGGGIPQAQSGFVQSMGQYAGAGGADQASQLFGGLGSAIGGSGFKQNAGSKIGGGIGKTAGSLIGGPIGGLIGGAVGGLAGGLIDQKGKKIAANQEATQQNLQTAAFNSGAQALQNQYSSFMREGGLVPYEEGGWVSHDWQPQVIATFGEHKMSDLLRPDPSMDTLRTGGHITQNNMYPQDRYALGGELKTTWGGHAESMSHNPYMPGTGETVMFRGKSHDESDGNGHTGIGVKYGAGDHDSYTDYAEYGTEQADADVEVERGEPAAEMMDPATGDKSMVVFGNLQIPNSLAHNIGDPNAKGKKFKNYVADLAKKEDKQNKIIDKSINSINELNVYTPFDKLSLDTHQANIIGANMNLKTYADYKMNAAAVQNAINDTAAEHGLDADALARGKQIKDKELMKQQAKYGKEILKAQGGLAALSQNIIGQNLSNTPVYDEFGGIDHYVDVNGKVVGSSGKVATATSKPATTTVKKTSATTATTATPATSAPPATSSSSSKLPGVKQADYEYLKGLYDEAKKQKKGDAVLKFQKEYHRLVPDYAKKVLSAYPPTTHGGKHKPKYTNKDLASNEDEIFGKRTERYMAALDKSPRYEMTVTAPTPEDMPEEGSTDMSVTTTTTPLKPVEALKRSKLIDYGNMLLPYVRPTDADYNVDLYPEMTALSMNQLEPVQSQLYRPQLLTPYDVSYQDQLNEVTAQSRAAERMSGYDPAAAASIMAQANRAKSQILGEQFRQNQAQRMGVYNQNIGTLNDAQLKNLGILDTQYERQAKAKSNTKQQAIEIAKSMADKVDKNKLENKTLQVYENMYNYRFGANGKAENYNPLAQFDVALGGSGTGKTSGGIAPGYEFTYDATGNIIGTKKSAKSKDDTARNGSIVKAIKGL